MPALPKGGARRFTDKRAGTPAVGGATRQSDVYRSNGEVQDLRALTKVPVPPTRLQHREESHVSNSRADIGFEPTQV